MKIGDPETRMPNNLDPGQVEHAVQSLRGPVRLRTLTTLRWLAVAGQTSAIFFVHFGLGFSTPLGFCLAAIAVSAWLNLFAAMRFSPQRFLSDREATGYIAFDIIQLCVLLALTGGLLNPFAVLIIAPVTIAASVLPVRLTILVGALAIAGVSVLALIHLPLPWRPGETIALPGIYKAGVWVALSFSVMFFAAYARRIAAESGEMKSALAATQLVLSREERLAALGGLAAAAAHELGTPLATIQVTAKEMARDLEDDPAHAEDAMLLVSQAQRCRNILSSLTEHGSSGDPMHDRLSVDALLRETAGPFMDQPGGAAIIFELIGADGAVDELTLRRQPEILYGLRNFIENASEFARSKVLMMAEWDRQNLAVTIHDDGPGFSPDVLARLGEPYVSTRSTNRKKRGMGLGFFISKTLLERTGAIITFDNQPWRDAANVSGAWVSVVWPLEAVQTDAV